MLLYCAVQWTAAHINTYQIPRYFLYDDVCHLAGI